MSAIQYRPEIDGLRAIAVVPVILFHAGVPLFGGGFIGVDVFFVISGYLITSIILRDLEKDRFSVVDFYERRARRILPSLYIVCLSCIPIAWTLLTPREMKEFSGSLVSTSAFVSNIFFWRQAGYFDSSTELKPLLHTWSLAVEEQYYVIFPIAISLMWRHSRKMIPMGIIVFFCISLAFAQWGSHNKPEAAFYLLPTRGWELLVGAFIAINSMKRSNDGPDRRFDNVISCIGISLVTFSIFWYNKSTPFPSLYTLAPTVGTALIIWSASRRTVVGKILSSRFLVGIGLISYSAYLWHQPLFAFARQFSSEPPAPSIMVAISVACLLLAYLTWRFVEIPFRDRKLMTRSFIFTSSFIGGILLMAFGLVGANTNGFIEDRTTGDQRHLLSTATPSPRRNDCHTREGSKARPSDACEYHSGRLTIATFGDSHAVELSYALADALKVFDEKIKHFSYSGCAPSFQRMVDKQESACQIWTDQTIEYIAKRPEIKTVVVSYRINYHLFGGHEGIYPTLPTAVPAEETETVWRSYVGVLKHLVDQGKSVILVLQAPELPRPVDSLIMRANNPAEAIAGVSRSWWELRNSFVKSRIRSIPKGVIVVDPAERLCNGTICLAADQGKSYYFDDDHLSIAGAQLVAQDVVKSIQQLASHSK